MKICQVGAELFHVDTKMDMTKLTVHFCNVDSALKNKKTLPQLLHNCLPTHVIHFPNWYDA